MTGRVSMSFTAGEADGRDPVVEGDAVVEHEVEERVAAPSSVSHSPVPLRSQMPGLTS